MTADELVDQLDKRGLLELCDRVCEQRGVTIELVLSHSRRRAIVWARHELWALCRDLEGRNLSYPDLGELFDRDHTTIICGIRAHRQRQETTQ